MKTTPIAIALVIGLLPNVQAETENAPKKKRLPKFVRIFDLDGDGKLNAEERAAYKEARAAKRQEFIETWDTDENGKLSKKEIRAARKAIIAEIREKRKEKFLAIAGDDELISADEFAAIPAFDEWEDERVAKLFDRLDRNDDEMLTFGEFKRKFRKYRP